MTNENGEKILLYDTAHDIWEIAKKTYSHVDDTSELF